MDYVWGILLVSVAVVSTVYLYVFVIKDLIEYRKARTEIFAFVGSYKKRCTGNNRFVVTTESLQDSFREYEISIIKKVWEELIRERLIEQDTNDQEWVVR